MAAGAQKTRRCAVYTRKSSEEGLEQSFNSLDAQREACEAYIESQRHEGWNASRERYDDGGFSGGTMDRPALQRLLADIETGKVDVVVVYKVDRLTRALSDFAKIVELFDRHEVSFVSVTQQFNTTSSMGRLTLNVLLSFAQFEREVTGERIRDKIAASKKKGMWMGGPVPLGYDLKDRKLLVNEKEAELVRTIYQRYLDLGQVRDLQAELKTKGVRSKRRTSRIGNTSGGLHYSRGALYAILRNRLYLGEIPHQDRSYPGEHEAIIPRDLWDRVQAQLTSNRQAEHAGLRAKTPSLLAGLLFDAKGSRFTPAHAAKGGKRYRYYVSQAVIRKRIGRSGETERLPAQEIEALVLQRIERLISSKAELLEAVPQTPKLNGATKNGLIASAKSWAERWRKLNRYEARTFLRACVSRVILSEESADLHIAQQGLVLALQGSDTSDVNRKDSGRPSARGEGSLDGIYVIHIAAQLKRCSSELRVVLPASGEPVNASSPSAALIKAVARARKWYEMLITGEIPSTHALAKVTGLNERYVSRILRLAFLAPEIIARILDGSQPAELTLDRLMRGVPTEWLHQRKLMAIYPTASVSVEQF